MKHQNKIKDRYEGLMKSGCEENQFQRVFLAFRSRILTDFQF